MLPFNTFNVLAQDLQVRQNPTPSNVNEVLEHPDTQGKITIHDSFK